MSNFFQKVLEKIVNKYNKYAENKKKASIARNESSFSFIKARELKKEEEQTEFTSLIYYFIAPVAFVGIVVSWVVSAPIFLSLFFLTVWLSSVYYMITDFFANMDSPEAPCCKTKEPEDKNEKKANNLHRSNIQTLAQKKSAEQENKVMNQNSPAHNNTMASSQNATDDSATKENKATMQEKSFNSLDAGSDEVDFKQNKNATETSNTNFDSQIKTTVNTVKNDSKNSVPLSPRARSNSIPNINYN